MQQYCRSTSASMDEYPPMKSTQYSERGLANIFWDCHKRDSHIRTPDVTCKVKVEMFTLGGMYEFELTRFDSVSRVLLWDDSIHPDPEQKMCIQKYLNGLRKLFHPTNVPTYTSRYGDPRQKTIG